MISNRLFAFSAEVRHALATHKPVVALESTIITHGMPMPSNLDTALAVERIIRERGAVPATIALIGGRVRVGLESSELEELADLNSGFKAVKASRRDLGLVLAKGWTGSTTVAATSLIANRVGIKVFVTGGIGGVHREGHISMDVSADLTELGRTPIAVVCAGIKSILDIPRTLEFLETQGVPVVSFGTKEFPAFYTPHSGVESIARMDSAEECASLIHAQDELGLQNGVVIGVPIPSADVEIDGAELEACIANALVKADKIGVKGKEVTPFLLSKVKDVTKGKSLNAS
ncbi:indigoidine synthesis protein [Chytriomyces sp. MP71]|nr:indigoidine synthesis protein [Chytriomyces sp. MP71]